EELMDRFERIGNQIINRLSGGPMMGDVIGAALGDRYKRRAAARILGQAYITAYACMRHNREGVARVAETLMERRELYGDEVTELLDAASLEAPAIAFSHNDKTQSVGLSTWSTWQPTRGNGDPVQQIVDHVGPEYRLPDGKQIVAVTGGPSQIEGIPLVVALRSDPAKNGATNI